MESGGTVDGEKLAPEVEIARFLNEVTEHSIERTDLVVSLAEAGNLKEAMESARDIGSSLFYLSALRAIAIAQVKAGLVDEALETIRRIDDTDEQIQALKHFPSIPSNADTRLDSYLLKAALKAVEDIRDEKNVSEKAWRDVMELAKAGDFVVATKCACEIGDPTWRSWALQEIATSQAKARDFPAALYAAGGVTAPGLTGISL